MKKLIRMLTLLLAVLSFYFVVSADELQKGVDAAKSVNIFILNTGDIHEASGKLAKISQYVDQERDKHGANHVLLLDAGDMLSHWTPESPKPFTASNRDWALERKKERGSKIDQIYKWALRMKYDAMILGNHDFDEGIDLLKTFPKLPFICANLEYPSNSPFYLGKNGEVPLYKIITKNGVNIGIIGISEQADKDKKDTNKDYHFPSKEDKKNLKAYPVNNKYIKENLITEVQRQSDFIVILSHNKDEIDRKYVATLDIEKPFIIIGGHSHKVIPEKKKLSLPKGCYLIKSGKEGEYIGSTMITWDPASHKVTNVTVKNILMK